MKPEKAMKSAVAPDGPRRANSARNAIVSHFDATTRLAKRVLDGEVVFFVGSGFSIDSEGNTSDRLVGRLLAGLLAMCTVLAEERGDEHSQARSLLLGLERVFSLSGVPWPPGNPPEPARCMTETNIKLLSREYYNFNEWSVSALTVLTGELLEVDEARRDQVASLIERLANFLLSLVGETVPLDSFDWRVLEKFTDDASRGKAVFLDIMGFANEAVMAGRPREADIEKVARSYGGRLRPRHHALARLAREGLTPATVTTNYDLLLEGAYRLAGFIDRESGAKPEDLPTTSVPRYSCIAGAGEFFTHGEGYRTALLLKIHGSAEEYREARRSRIDALKKAQKLKSKGDAPDLWSAYLPAMVFTYREIQTWRTDAWSRDLIRTLLRTHTLTMCGYSGADPVMHATFREVYDERATTRAVISSGSMQGGAENAPVFFFGRAARREFYSLEILRAATAAGGYRARKLVEHPNHIEFEPSTGFPSLDDHFRWIVHCVARDMQFQALTGRLRRLVPLLLGHPCPDEEFKKLCDRFVKLCKAERATVAALGDPGSKVSSDSRQRTFDGIVGWTWHFLPGLLRELALAELVESRQGPGEVVRLTRAVPFYHPASERPEWTAWAAVVELALRCLVATWRKKKSGSLSDTRWLVAEESPHAAISFSLGDTAPLPNALCIRLAGFDRLRRSQTLIGAFRHVEHWELGERDVPWPVKPTGSCPEPKDLWNWAIGESVTAEEAARHLGASM